MQVNTCMSRDEGRATRNPCHSVERGNPVSRDTAVAIASERRKSGGAEKAEIDSVDAHTPTAVNDRGYIPRPP